MVASFHRVLKGTDTKEGFLGVIRLPDSDDRTLRVARDKIRTCITDAFRRAGEAEPLRKAFLVERAPAAFTNTDFLRGFRPSPRFRGQGSYTYGTLNDPVPEHTPPQQVDLDDGVFLPTSFISQGRPVLAARAYFKVVEDALKPLCRAEGWMLCSDKNSCVRVQLNKKIHVDLALYALPDKDYEQAEALEKALRSRGIWTESVEFSEGAYKQLPPDQIMLAKRDGTWQPSDPRKLDVWFRDAVNRHGPHLKHVCRYLKAWRDLQWVNPHDGISSITLMAITVRAFDENRTRLDANREDDALLAVAERMPTLLQGRIRNPVVHGQYLDDDWPQETRQRYIRAAEQLRDHLKAARDATQAYAVLSRLNDCLGDRVPHDADLVQVVPTEERAILSQPAQRVAAPVVGRHISG